MTVWFIHSNLFIDIMKLKRRYMGDMVHEGSYLSLTDNVRSIQS